MDLDTIFKAYDVRGLVPEQLDEDAARRIGAAFARFAGAPRIAVGRDCRESVPRTGRRRSSRGSPPRASTWTTWG